MSEIRSYDVHLHGVKVGRLVEHDGYSHFESYRSYREMVGRPVLGQNFEDDLDKVRRGRGRDLPPFFANLVPEGEELRRLLERSLDVARGDDLALLEAVGGDLPGAVEIRRSEVSLHPLESSSDPDASPGASPADVAPGLRFSLAGAQLKFSVLLAADKVTLPAVDEQGDWIVKIEASRFRGLVENEHATMTWARAAGFEVPECRVLTGADMGGVSGLGNVPEGASALAVRRFDRMGSRRTAGRIHQEDLAQVLGVPPRERYERVTYEKVAQLIAAVVGKDAALEFVRRLVFVVVSGNFDAHLKNWSLIYRDPQTPSLAPIYDQVAVVAWPSIERTWALKIAGTRSPSEVNLDRFEELGHRAEIGGDAARAVASEALVNIHAAWEDTAKDLPWPEDHRQALRDHWNRLPLVEW